MDVDMLVRGCQSGGSGRLGRGIGGVLVDQGHDVLVSELAFLQEAFDPQQQGVVAFLVSMLTLRLLPHQTGHVLLDQRLSMGLGLNLLSQTGGVAGVLGQGGLGLGLVLDQSAQARIQAL